MTLESYFKQAIEKKASDIHLVAGAIPVLRINGELYKIEETVLSNKELETELKAKLDKKIWAKFTEEKEADFSLEILGVRFRVNLHLQRDQIGLAARLIQDKIPQPEELGFTPVMNDLARLRDGLILVTGPSGNGKSTTLAAMLEIINADRRAHIITIEDPIEYVFNNKLSIIEQRELGQDTNSFGSALKHVLRQDPNVIMIGEMRDTETIAAALTAAETGHLVLSTLHTTSASDTVARIVDSFPAYQQEQVLIQLALTLRAVISQHLLPKTNGGLVAAREILINNQAVANLIRRNQLSQVQTVIQTSSKEGMIPFNKAIDNLLGQGLISQTIANNRRRNLDTQASYN